MATAKKTAAAKTAAPEPSIGDQIDKIWNLREERRKLDAESKKLKEQEDALSELILLALDEAKVEGVRGAIASVSISKNVIPQVEDWSAFHAWIGKTKNFQMLEKRAAAPAYREQLELGKKVPGVVPFTKRTLNLRTV